MRREDLESYLARGNKLGFVKETSDPAYLGWIMVSKEEPNERALEVQVSTTNTFKNRRRYVTSRTLWN
jgi:hypothetical protein